MVGPEPANLAAPRVLSSFGGNNTWCRREGPKIRRSWKIFLTGSLIGAGVGVLMALNSSRSGRETLREEVASETPLGMRRPRVSRQVRTMAEPVVEAMQSVGRRVTGDCES